MVTVLQDADREGDGDGGGEGELSVNQMELLELEMRARAIKAMLLAQEQRENQTNSWHCTKTNSWHCTKRSNSCKVVHHGHEQFFFVCFLFIYLFFLHQINCLVFYCC